MLSLWRDNVCAGSFRLAVDEVPDLIDDAPRRPDRAYDVARRSGVAAADRAPDAGVGDTPTPEHAQLGAHGSSAPRASRQNDSRRARPAAEI